MPSCAGAARPIANDTGKGDEHGGQAALDVASAAAIETAVLDTGAERVDGHVVGRHRVLVGLEDEGAPSARQVAAGDDVVALRSARLAFIRDAEGAEEVFEVGGDAVLEELDALGGTAHRVDAGQGDEVAQQTRGVGMVGAGRHGISLPAKS